MTFDEAYREFYQSTVYYCNAYVNKNMPSAEEIADDVFILLSKKWEELESHEAPVLMKWVLSAARFRCYEYWRTKPPITLSYDEDAIQGQIAKQMIEQMSLPDAFEEYVKFEAYKEQVKALLTRNKDIVLFEYVVEREMMYREIAPLMNISEDAVKMRWIRLRAKLRPLVDKLIKRNM